MFKGLKSKIAEETKKLQNDTAEKRVTVDDSEHLNQMLVDISSNADAASPLSDPTRSDPFSFFEGRKLQRHDSASSITSLDSNMSFFMPGQNNFGASSRLDVIPSDLESVADNDSVAGSSFVSGASKEQISSVLNRLQGRAANYKDKYRQLVKVYNEVVKENEKIRTVLTTTQDKALRRIQELREEKRLQERSKRDLEEDFHNKLVAKEKAVETMKEQMRLLKAGEPVDEINLNDTPSEHPPELLVHKERVRKLEELLSRCKDTMKTYKDRIQSLTDENSELKTKVTSLEQEEGNAGMSDFVTDRIAGEYKLKLQQMEDDYKQKLVNGEEQVLLAVAQTKQEMHSELEQKDIIIENLRDQLRQADSTGSSKLQQLQQQLTEAKEIEKLLDQEKQELLEQLSRSKQESLQIVQDQANAKCQQLEEDWNKKLRETESKYMEKIEELETRQRDIQTKKAQEFNNKLLEHEEQMQLAVEEREFQKNALAAKYDERIDRLLGEIEQLKTEKLEYQGATGRHVEELENRIRQLTETIERSEGQNSDVVEVLRNDNDQLQQNLTEKNNLLQATVAESQEKLMNLKKELEEQLAHMEKQHSEEMKNISLENERTKSELVSAFELRMSEELEKKTLEFDETLKERNNEIDRLSQSLSLLEKEVQQKRDELAEKERLLSATMGQDEIVDQLHCELNSLREERNAIAAQLESSKSDLEQLRLENDEHKTNICDLSKAKHQQVVELSNLTGALQQAVANYRIQLQEKESENEQVRQSLSYERNFLAVEQSNRLTDVMGKVDDLEEAIGAYQKQSSLQTGELSKREEEIKLLKDRLEGVIRQGYFYACEKDLRLNDSLNRIDELEQALEDYKKRFSAEIAEKERLTNELTFATNQLAEQKSAGSSAAENLEQLKSEYENLLQKMSVLERESTDSAIKINNDLQQFFSAASSVATLQFDDCNKDSEKFSRLTETLRQYVEKVRWLQSDIAGAEQAMQGLEDDRNRLNRELNSTKDRLASMTGATEQMEELNVELISSRKREAELQKAVESLRLQLNEAGSEKQRHVAQMEEKMSKLKEALAESGRKIDDLSSRLNVTEEAINNEKRTAEAAVEKNITLTTKLREMEQQLESVEQLRQETLQTSNSNQESLNTAVMELQTSKAEVEETKLELNSLRQRLEEQDSMASTEKEKLQKECDSRVADYKKKAEIKLSQMQKQFETEKNSLNKRIDELQTELTTKLQTYDRISEELNALKETSCRDEKESQENEQKMKLMADEHNEKVKQLCKEFQMELSKKETEWQDELNAAYSKSEEDRHRANREYQKEAKQLLKDLQEKSKVCDEMSNLLERLHDEQTAEISKLKAETEEEMHHLEETWSARLKQKLEEQETRHKEEMDGLTSEWSTERKSVAPGLSSQDVSRSTGAPGTNSQLENQAQIAQGDIRQESPLYLKQRVKQLETQIEAMKEKQKKEFEVLMKNGVNSVNDRSAEAVPQPRLTSVSLESYSADGVFAEPTEAEYLKNILFRYMVERETLGKESVTLVKAIAAVLKFSNDQTRNAVAKEESRVTTW